MDNNESRLELLKSEVQNYTEDQLLTCIIQLEKKWRLDCVGDPWVPLTNGFKQFYSEDQLTESGLPKELDIERISDKHRSRQQILGSIYHKSVALGLFDTDTMDVNNNEFKVSVRINRLIDIADDAYEMVFRYARQYERINHPTCIPINPEADHSLFRCTTLDLEDISSYQNLLLALLSHTYRQNFRRYKEYCCKQIETFEGYHTKAWKQIMPVTDFVHATAQKETNGTIWKDMTTRASHARDATRHLNECKDMQFPEITKNRNVWSFRNGLFIGKVMDPNLGEYTCKFYPYESSEFRSLDATIVSSKYFDKQFDTFPHIENWWDIPTPHFQSVLKYQKFDAEVSKWMYVMGGRLCFDVGDIDRWQVIPFLKGIAGSGKSTLITKVFKKFYDSDDVRTLSNNIERKFGLSSIYDGFMFISPEVKGDMCLEQAEFQSLVSGEDVSIAQKYAKAKSVEWKTPGVLGGNEVPNWKDNSGSVLRRILPWNFSKKVMEADTHLDDKLDQELPAIMYKCIRAYLDYAQKYGDKDIWNVVPEYFKSAQVQIAMVTNSLQNFLASEKVIFSEDAFCPQKIFVQIFNQHCQENNLGRFKFNPDFYAGPFSSRGLEVITEARTYKGRAYPIQPFVCGIDIVDDTLQFSDDL